MAAVTLAGCACARDPVTGTAYAPIASYPTELTACMLRQGCAPLCRAVLHIGDAEIRRCELVAFDGLDPGAPPRQPLTPGDLQQLRGATVRVTYVPDACADGGSAWGDGHDSSTDDGSADDGSTDDGSTDDGSTDDGSTDDGSTDDGSTDDGSTDDGSTDDGSTDDGSTDDGSTPRARPPASTRR
jgi:hypothetical protein